MANAHDGTEQKNGEESMEHDGASGDVEMGGK